MKLKITKDGMEMDLAGWFAKNEGKDDESPSQSKLKKQINLGEREGGGKDDAAPMHRRQHAALDAKHRTGVERPSKQMSAETRLKQFKKGSSK